MLCEGTHWETAAGRTPGAAEKPLPRLLVVTGYPPNARMGGGLILRNLLKEYPAGRLTVLTTRPVVAQMASDPSGGLLPVPHVAVAPWQSSLPGVRRLLRSLNGLKMLTATAAGLRRLSSGDVILAVPWGGELGSELFAAAFGMHRLSGAALVVYEMDEWRASLGPSAGRVTRLLEWTFHARLVRAAKAVWVISPALAEEMRRRFGVEAKVLAHCVEVERYAGVRAGTTSHGGPRRILFTGSVYEPQADAIRNVLQAIQAEPGLPYTLVLHTGQSAAELAGKGIGGPGLQVEKLVPIEAMPELLAGADVLLLPFAFAAGQQAVVSTSFPTKAADYLASGVPVLVHAPPYATVARLAREEGWGAVVDQPCPEQLRAALRRLVTDGQYRQALTTQAQRVARQRHDLATRRAEFLDSIREAAHTPGA